MRTKYNQTTLAVIPARYSSSRFPGKPLAKIDGKTMIQHVWERAVKTKGIDEVVVATDDERILLSVEKFGGEAILTSSNHKTGTDRIVEALSGRSCDWVLNVQGDEPLISPIDLENLIKKAQNTYGIKGATLIYKINDHKMLKDPNVVKVAFNKSNHALYFSRSLIPYQFSANKINYPIWRHLGVYLFQRDFLVQFQKWPQTPLEKNEKLEQLRILENGETLLCVEAKNKCISVDVPSDVLLVEKVLESKKTRKR